MAARAKAKNTRGAAKRASGAARGVTARSFARTLRAAADQEAAAGDAIRAGAFLRAADSVEGAFAPARRFARAEEARVPFVGASSLKILETMIAGGDALADRARAATARRAASVARHGAGSAYARHSSARRPGGATRRGSHPLAGATARRSSKPASARRMADAAAYVAGLARGASK